MEIFLNTYSDKIMILFTFNLNHCDRLKKVSRLYFIKKQEYYNLIFLDELDKPHLTKTGLEKWLHV